MSLYTDLKDAGIPLDHYESDLQFKWTAKAQDIYAEHQRKRTECGQRPLTMQTFHNQKPEERGQWWAEVPFAYDPLWFRNA